MTVISFGIAGLGQQTELWSTLQTSIHLTSRWGMAVDLNHRWRNNELWRSDISAVRAGAVYFTRHHGQVTAGYAWFGTHTTNHFVPLLNEHRFYQQWLIPHAGEKITWSHRIRFEQRFLEQQTGNITLRAFGLRLRYMFSLGIPLQHYFNNKKPSLLWIAANEIMAQAGKRVGKHYFDQNRLITGLEWRSASNHSIFLLYQYTNRYRLATENVANVHVIRFTASLNLDLRKQP